MLNANGKEHLRGFPFSFGWAYLTEPFTMVEEAHSHIYRQTLVFMGGDPNNIKEFDAEIWMHFGEEQDRFVITSPILIAS